VIDEDSEDADEESDDNDGILDGSLSTN